jgi:hypothetical protein
VNVVLPRHTGHSNSEITLLAYVATEENPRRLAIVKLLFETSKRDTTAWIVFRERLQPWQGRHCRDVRDLAELLERYGVSVEKPAAGLN